MSTGRVVPVSCGACCRTGMVPMPDHLRLVLPLVRSRGGTSSAAVAAALGIKQTTAINRLERLRALGFAARNRDGKTNVYRGLVP